MQEVERHEQREDSHKVHQKLQKSTFTHIKLSRGLIGHSKGVLHSFIALAQTPAMHNTDARIRAYITHNSWESYVKLQAASFPASVLSELVSKRYSCITAMADVITHPWIWCLPPPLPPLPSNISVQLLKCPFEKWCLSLEYSPVVINLPFFMAASIAQQHNY